MHVDDLRAWVYRGEFIPTDDEIVQFVDEILEPLPEERKIFFKAKYRYFKSEAIDLKRRAIARLSGESEY